MSTYAFLVGQVVNGNTIIALPTGSGNYGGMYQLQRPDATTFYDYLSLTQLQASLFDVGFDGEGVNASNPLPVAIISGGGGGSSSGGIGTATTPNVSTIGDPAAPSHQAAVLVPGGAGTYALTVQGVAGGTALPVSGTFFQATQPVSLAASVAVTGTFFQATQPVSNASLPLPAGAATSALQPTINVDGGAQTHVMNFPATQPVSIASAVAVTGTFFQTTQPVSLAASVAVTGTFFQATQPVSAASLPLPAGAATAAKQPALGVAGTPATDVITVQGAAAGTGLPVTGTFFQATQPVSAAALPLPAGAATAAKQPALGTAGTPATDVITVQGSSTGTAQAMTNGGGTSVVTSVASSTTVATALSAGTRRKWIVTNDTAVLMYVKIGTAASAISYTYCLSPKTTTAGGGSCEGTDTTAITVILASGTGNALVTEVTA
jgi:hypothetical protein